VVIVVYWYLLDLKLNPNSVIMTMMILKKLILSKLSDGEYTNELGGLIGLLGVGVITIVYIILFGVMDWDWINIFKGISPIELLKLKW